MSPETDFDPSVYFGIVADNLLSKLGQRSLGYAEAALVKMRSLGDDEGLAMWNGIHAALVARCPEPAGAVH